MSQLIELKIIKKSTDFQLCITYCMYCIVDYTATVQCTLYVQHKFCTTEY